VVVKYPYMADGIQDLARGVGGKAAKKESRTYMQESLQHKGSRFCISMSYCLFCLKFRCHGCRKIWL